LAALNKLLEDVVPDLPVTHSIKARRIIYFHYIFTISIVFPAYS